MKTVIAALLGIVALAILAILFYSFIWVLGLIPSLLNISILPGIHPNVGWDNIIETFISGLFVFVIIGTAVCGVGLALLIGDCIINH
jgi:uncharacterized protein YqhQ